MVRTAGKPVEPAPAHIVGPVPALARVGAVTAILASVLLVIARFLPYADVGGIRISPPHAPLDIVAALLWAGVIAAAGCYVVLGRLPRLWLAVLAVSGALAIGLGIGELYQLQGAGAHRGVEVFFGRRAVTSSIDALAGVWVHLSAYLLLVGTLVLTLLAWPRTTMDDNGDFDGRRPLVMGLAALAGLAGVLAVSARPQDTPDQVLQDISGFRVSVEIAGEVSLLDRLGLDLLSGLLIAFAVFAVALLAATLRPRLATVGALIGLAAYFLSSALLLLLESGRYADLVIAPGGVLYLLSGLAFAALAAYCVRADGRDQDARTQLPTGRG